MTADGSNIGRELHAYATARDLCLKAEPPCPVRPCARHHAEAYEANGAEPCPACGGSGTDSNAEPCEVCDGYGRCWIVPVSALASIAPGGSAATGAVDGGPGRVPVPPSGQVGASTLQTDNRRERTLPAAECGPVRPQNGR